MAKGRRFFRKKKPALVLIDERVAPLVLPPPPMNLSLEEDDDILYGEDLEDTIIEPLRIFIGSGLQEEPKTKFDHIWDVDEEDSFEDSDDEPLQIRIGGIGPAREEKQAEPAISLGVATLANASLPEEIFAEMETEEIFVPQLVQEEEQDSVEHVMTKGEWLYTNTEQDNIQKSIATLNTALLPIEEESVLLEGELDFSQLDINQTIEELEARTERFDASIREENVENVLTLSDLRPQDFDVPNILLRPKQPDHIRVQPVSGSVFWETDPAMEPTEVVSHSARVHIVVKKQSSVPYFEMGIAFAITLSTLFVLWFLFF